MDLVLSYFKYMLHFILQHFTEFKKCWDNSVNMDVLKTQLNEERKIKWFALKERHVWNSRFRLLVGPISPGLDASVLCKPQVTLVPHYLQYLFTMNSTISVLVTLLHINIRYLKGSACDFQKKSAIFLSTFARIDTNMYCPKALTFVLITLLTHFKLTGGSSPLSVCHVEDL